MLRPGTPGLFDPILDGLFLRSFFWCSYFGRFWTPGTSLLLERNLARTGRAGTPSGLPHLLRSVETGRTGSFRTNFGVWLIQIKKMRTFSVVWLIRGNFWTLGTSPLLKRY